MIVPSYFTASVYHVGHTIFCRISCFLRDQLVLKKKSKKKRWSNMKKRNKKTRRIR